MMGGLRHFWPLIISLSISCLSEARHLPHESSAVVVGAVFSDTCFKDDMSKGKNYISGATVAVECAGGASRPAFYQEIKTDEEGKFKIQLPFSISKNVKIIDGCTVKLVKSSDPYCTVASTATPSLIHLNDKKEGKHIFSAGLFTFKPLKQQSLCGQQPSVTNSRLQSLQDFFPNPALPSIPTLPNPGVPRLPALIPPTLPNPNIPLMTNLPYIPPLPPLPELPKLPPLPLLPPFPVTPVAPFKDEEESGLVEHPQQLFWPIIPPLSTSLEDPLPTTIPNPFQTLPLVPSPFHPPTSATPSPLVPNPLQPSSPPATILPPEPPLPNLPYLPPVPRLTLPTPSLPTPTLIPTIPGIIPPFIPLPPTP